MFNVEGHSQDDIGATLQSAADELKANGATHARATIVPIEAYPNGVDRESLDDSTGFRRSTRDAYLQRLTAKELVSEPRRGSVQASAQLFG